MNIGLKLLTGQYAEIEPNHERKTFKNIPEGHEAMNLQCATSNQQNRHLFLQCACSFVEVVVPRVKFNVYKNSPKPWETMLPCNTNLTLAIFVRTLVYATR